MRIFASRPIVSRAPVVWRIVFAGFACTALLVVALCSHVPSPSATDEVPRDGLFDASSGSGGPLNGPDRFRVDSNLNSESHQARLASIRAISGRVTSRGLPVMGATVTLVASEAKATASSQADGTFSIDARLIRPGTSHIVTCFRDGYRPYRHADSFQRESLNEDLLIDLEPNPPISVTISFEQVGTLAPVRLLTSLKSQTGTVVYHSFVSFRDGTGYVPLTDLGQQRLEGFVSVMGCRLPVQGNVDRSRGDPHVVLKVESNTRVLRIEALDAASGAAVGGSVWVRCDTSSSQLEADSHGRFELLVPDPIAATQEVVFWSPNAGVSESLSLEKLSASPRVLLGDHGCRIRLRGANLRIEDIVLLGTLRECQFLTREGQGELVAWVPPGDYMIQYDQKQIARRKVSAGDDVTIEHDAEERSSINGSVRQAARVIISRADGPEVVFDEELQAGSRIRLSNVIAGRFNICAIFGGSMRLPIDLELSPGQQADLGQLGTDSLQALTLSLRHQSGAPLSHRAVVWSEHRDRSVIDSTWTTDANGGLVVNVPTGSFELRVALQGEVSDWLVTVPDSAHRVSQVLEFPDHAPLRTVRVPPRTRALAAVFVQGAAIFRYSCPRVGHSEFWCLPGNPDMFLRTTDSSSEAWSSDVAEGELLLTKFPDYLISSPPGQVFRAECYEMGNYRSSISLFAQVLRSNPDGVLRLNWPPGSAGWLAGPSTHLREPIHVR